MFPLAVALLLPPCEAETVALLRADRIDESVAVDIEAADLGAPCATL